MESLLLNILLFFFYGLFGGLLLYWPIVSTEETGRGFQGLLAKVILSGLLLLAILSWGLPLYGYLGIGLSFLGLVYMAFKSRQEKIFSLLTHRLGDGEVPIKDSDRRDLGDWVSYGLALLGIFIFAYALYGGGFFSLFFALSSLALTGIVTFLMALGHYYLVMPDLTERPLVLGSYILWGVLGGKMILSLWGFQESWGYFSEGSQLGDGFLMNWVFASMRVLWGFVSLGLLSIFSYRLAKMKSFQSATGVFYSMVFFVFVGELLSAYFFHKFGVFL